ncbi:MAG: glycosyltransferase family 4 protein [Bacteroidota bacterium]
MNILHISTPRSWRGGEQQVAYLVQALHEAGIPQGVLCPAGATLSTRSELQGIEILSFQSRGPLGINLAQRIAHLVRRGSFTLIHTHDSHAHTAAVLAATLFGMPLPVVVSRRVDFPVSPGPFSTWKYNHSAIHRILCVSEEIRKITVPAIRNKSILSVIRSGVDAGRYTTANGRESLLLELGLAPDTRLVGNLSALADHKDYPTWLRAAACLRARDPQLHFVIAGSGPDEREIRHMITALGLSTCVHLLGFRSDVAEVMSALDVFMISSKTEGLGTIVIEAFAAGVPVVATRAGGIPELVEDGVNGILCPVGDEMSLCASVRRIFDEPGLAQRLGAAGKERSHRFSFRSTAAQTLEVYRQITGS